MAERRVLYNEQQAEAQRLADLEKNHLKANLIVFDHYFCTLHVPNVVLD